MPSLLVELSPLGVDGEVVVCTRTVPASLAATDLWPKPLSLIVNYQLTKNG